MGVKIFEVGIGRRTGLVEVGEAGEVSFGLGLGERRRRVLGDRPMLDEGMIGRES